MTGAAEAERFNEWSVLPTQEEDRHGGKFGPDLRL